MCAALYAVLFVMAGLARLQPLCANAEEGAAGSRPNRSRSEVLDIIEKAAKSKPDWWADTSLNYPESLDLTWPKPEGPWDARNNVGQYMWSIINENPHARIAGPRFIAPQKDDFRLRPRSPALALGFQPFCLEGIGPRPSPEDVQRNMNR